MKFVHYVFTEHFVGRSSYEFKALELFELWQMFISECGLESKRDLNWCDCCFENTVDIEKTENGLYRITNEEVEKILSVF